MPIGIWELLNKTMFKGAKSNQFWLFTYSQELTNINKALVQNQITLLNSNLTLTKP